MTDLPRIQPTEVNPVLQYPEQRLDEAIALTEKMAFDLPTKVELRSLFEASLLPPRALSAREVLRYRMLEICRSACNSFKKSEAVSGAILTRAAFETATLMFNVQKRIQQAIDDGQLGEVGEFLLKAIVGSKNNPNHPQAVNVLTLLKQLEKEHPGLTERYDYLCEIAHPNQMGTLVAFGLHGPDAVLNLGAKANFGQQFYPLLQIAIVVFGMAYNRLADSFPPFVELCRQQAPRTFQERPTETP